MDCCGGQNHQNNAEHHKEKTGNFFNHSSSYPKGHKGKIQMKEKKFPWTSIIIILLIVGLLVFSILK